ncbi:BA75_03357T0 [Komagataella pastoris]|uniref:BA75_03357T0 n=1 Tax=Komagataella pastoris TaxID=4922 RepID=A0A1B2JEP9_PICPA|nr:BA75_03357T0 [Komagataella pastoris]
MQFLFLLSAIVNIVSALRFELEAGRNPGQEKCIREFVPEGQLVVARIKSSGFTGDGQSLRLRMSNSIGDEYRNIVDFVDNAQFAFAATSSALDICFWNTQTSNTPTTLVREIEVEVEAGAAARDWNAVQASEKLKPAEVTLRKMESLVDEILNELEYLKRREERLRDTNESTNRRVRNFFIAGKILLVGLGLWQVNYLRNYFRSKHIL